MSTHGTTAFHRPRATTLEDVTDPMTQPYDDEARTARATEGDGGPAPSNGANGANGASAGSAAVSRILARHAEARTGDGTTWHHDRDGDQLDLADRQALRRVAGLSTELEDVTEVEYRRLRLERVVLAGLWTSGSVADAENSLRELAALAETAGSEVMDGVLQRRDNPDPGTWLGSGKAEDLRGIVSATGADTVVCDGDLSPSQRRSLRTSSRSRSSTGRR